MQQQINSPFTTTSGYQQPQTWTQGYQSSPPQMGYQQQPVYGYPHQQQYPQQQSNLNLNPQPNREQLWRELQYLEGLANQGRLQWSDHQRLQYLRGLFTNK
jgi:hypothetical protein